MFVLKRNGKVEKISLDKITSRIKKMSWGITMDYDPEDIAIEIIDKIYDNIKTTDIDILLAETIAYKNVIHPDYETIASRIEISNLHRETEKQFSKVVESLYTYINPRTNDAGPLISEKVYQVIQKHKDEIDSTIIYARDYSYDYFGIKTLMKSYLLKINGKIAERPQHMLMRVSIGIHGDDIKSAFETYNSLSKKYFTHATPTLFNAGTPRPQLSSCFLFQMKEDSIEGIFDTLKQTSHISKNAGGIGIAIHKIRASGSYIKGTNGISNGIVPMLRVFNNTARYVDQGGGKRKGSIAVYLEPWHADIFEFLELRKNHGNEEDRCRDLFMGLWIPDLFMKRVECNEKWSLMCPDECKGLQDCYGEDFEKLYLQYEEEKKYRKQINARDLWNAVVKSQIETGTPYMCYKDACNSKSNQKNLGTIQSSNLCTEIMEYTAPDEVAVCNLASISLPKCIKDGVFNFLRLGKITKLIAKNLNKIIDINYYPIKEAENSNLRHRPIGIGVQGLADVFMLLKLPFESEEAQQLNKDIFETIYYHSLETSMNIAKEEGPYSTFAGSPASKGILQFDMWNVVPSGRYKWDLLKEKIKEHGLRNSLLVAPMPTASTSQILGNNECFEPYTSNIYLRRTLAGEFICINKHLIKDCVKLGIWSQYLKNKLIADNGSVQNIDELPSNLKEIYKTVWEISQKTLIDMSAARGAYVDQSQSFNIHMDNINTNKISSMHFYGWKKGLKTGMYYLRSKPAASAIQFTVDAEQLKCSIENKEDCMMCSG